MFLDDLADEKLMVMYQNGSEDAFKILYNRHSAKAGTQGTRQKTTSVERKCALRGSPPSRG